jgi:hypothetical protein
MTAEQKVKSVYPEAEIKFAPTRTNPWDWSTDNYFNNTILALGVWVGGRCLSYGGKFEHLLWRRAWKRINKDMLRKMEQ